MNRRRKPSQRKTKQPPSSGAQEVSADKESASTDAPSNSPGTWLKVALSLWLVFHLGALTVSYTSVVEPSELQGRWQQALQFYLYPTHFLADDRPIYLAHGDVSEQPHRLQITTVKPSADPSLFRLPIDDPQWQTVEPPGIAGLAGNDRYSRWLSTAAILATNDQPSLVAELMLSVALKDPSITAVRIVRLPTQLTTTAADALPPPYAAYVAKQNDTVALVQVNEPRLSTAVRGGNDE
jgi:hypothetical protein